MPIATTTGGVRLRVEEDLRVPHALGGGAGEIGVGEVLEVLLGAQDGHELVVQVQEGLEVVEEVGGAQLFGVRVRQLDAVARGELEGQLGFEGSFDVEVEFGFGELTSRFIVRMVLLLLSLAGAGGTGTLSRSCATVSSPSNPAARAWAREVVRVRVPLGEVREHEMPYARLPGHPAACPAVR